MVNTRLPPISRHVSTAPVNTVPSVEGCPDCPGLEKISAMTKNRKNINQTINRHKIEVHGIPIHQPQQQQPQKQPSKKQKKTRPSSDEETDDGLIDGFSL